MVQGSGSILEPPHHLGDSVLAYGDIWPGREPLGTLDLGPGLSDAAPGPVFPRAVAEHLLPAPPGTGRGALTFSLISLKPHNKK